MESLRPDDDVMIVVETGASPKHIGALVQRDTAGADTSRRRAERLDLGVTADPTTLTDQSLLTRALKGALNDYPDAARQVDEPIAALR
jgi:hypothetical protein